MKNSIASALLSAIVVSGLALPAQAADSEDPVVSTVMLPVRLASLGTGIVVGTPVATVRHTIERVPQCTKMIAADLNGEDDPCTLVFSSLPGIPAGITMGLLEGIQDGLKNSYGNCVEKPFSSASMSLGEI